MGFFEKKKQTYYTVVIGCGRLGANIANTLSDKEIDVLIMDKDKEAFKKLSPSYGGLAIVGDGMDFDDLVEAKLNEADVVVVVTNNDNANVMIAQIAREIFKIKKVIARLYDTERECVYKEFGIDVICPSALSAREIDRLLMYNMG